MANDTNVRGAFPIKGPTGNIRVNPYVANTATNLFRGQLVAQNNSGQVFAIGTANNTASIGAIVGFLDSTHSGLPSGITLLSQGAFLPAGNDATVIVADDPNQLFLMEENTGGNALTAISAGQLVGFTVQSAASGSTITGYSNSVLVRASISSGTDGLLQLIAPLHKVNQDGTINAPGNFCQWVVRIFNHQLGTGKMAIPQG